MSDVPAALSLTEWIEYPRADRGVRFRGADGRWERLTYVELAQHARGWAAELSRADARADDVVPIVMSTGPEFIAAFYGTLLAGAQPVVLPLPWALSGKAPYAPYFTDLATAGAPRIAVAAPEYADEVRRTASACRDDITVLTRGHSGRADSPVAPGKNGLIQFTSGSRGVPRALRVSRKALEAQVMLLHAVVPDTGWVGVSWLPMYHDMGLIGNLLLPVSRQAEHALMSPEQFVLDPGAWLSEYGSRPYSTMTMPNFGFERVCRYARRMDLEGLDFSSVRMIITGAERVDPDVLARFSALLEPHGFDCSSVAPAYGMAETTLAVTCGTPPSTPATLVRIPAGARAMGGRVPVGDSRPLSSAAVEEPWLWHTSCGPALRGVTVDIVDREGASLPENTLGEIRVGSPSLAESYTAGDVGGPSRLEKDALYTGDAGFLREGELFVVGRLADALRLEHGTVFMEDVEIGLAWRLGVGPRRVVAVANDEEEPVVLVLTTFDPVPGMAVIQEFVESFTRGRARIEVMWVGRGGIPMTTSGKPRRATVWDLHRKGELRQVASHSLEGGAAGE
ncbi:AMP-binding protein [Streptomyces niveiscabiei]|uniref:AMP-binding protein n=1 Tax=Streptomyces niveiscabiei TaxID=164115 RepID=A0ABW9HJL6_9ACTN